MANGQAEASPLFVHRAYKQQNTARPSNADMGLGIRSVIGNMWWKCTSRQPDKVCLGWKMAMQLGGSFRAGLASF